LLTRLHAVMLSARFHLAGHSFGCIVASAAVAGPPDSAAARHGVDSLVLIQGAMSLWSFCATIPARPERAGYFRRVIEDGLVRGPVIATTSTHDRAVRVFYPLGAGVRGQIDFAPQQLPTFGGIGTFGIRGSGIHIVDSGLEKINGDYRFQPGSVYNLNADNVISAIQSRFSGAHSDICHPELARVIWRAVEH
jgi:pimeloyl-ACP methyl ester carboxylesterase